MRQGSTFAPDFFCNPTDWILDRIMHRACSGTIVEQEVFMNLDYADDVALLAEKQK